MCDLLWTIHVLLNAFVNMLMQMENMAFFYAELGLVNYSTAVRYCPSMLAASSIYAARCALKRIPHWTETLKHHTGFNKDQLT